MPDSGHHGEGEHDERDVTVPAMPRSGLMSVFKGEGADFHPPLCGAVVQKLREVVQGRRRARWTSVDML
jgi:hypothetical protein